MRAIRSMIGVVLIAIGIIAIAGGEVTKNGSWIAIAALAVIGVTGLIAAATSASR